MAKSKVVWITRDDDDQEGCCIWDYRTHPHKEADGKWNYIKTSNGDFLNCEPDMCRMLGITIAPGKRIRVRLEPKE